MIEEIYNQLRNSMTEEEIDLVEAIITPLPVMECLEVPSNIPNSTSNTFECKERSMRVSLFSYLRNSVIKILVQLSRE
jgi:hypothetical protein